MVSSSRRSLCFLFWSPPEPAVVAWSAGTFCSTPTVVRLALLFCGLPVSLTDAHRAFDLRLGIEVGLVDLPLVGVEAQRDADLEIVGPEVGRQRLA